MKKFTLLAAVLLAGCSTAIVVPLGKPISSDLDVPIYYNQMPNNCKAKEVALIIPTGMDINQNVIFMVDNAKRLGADFVKVNADTFAANTVSAIAYRCEK